AASSDGQRLVCLGPGPPGPLLPGKQVAPHWLHLHDAATLKDVGVSFPIPQSFTGRVAFSPAGDQLAGALTEQPQTRIAVWDAKTGQLVRTWLGKTESSLRWISGLVFAPSGRELAVAYHQPGGVDIWDVTTGGLVRNLPSREGMSRVICFA